MTLCRYLVKAALVILSILLSVNTAFAQLIQGTATYRERMALPPAAVFEAALEDVSRADAPAETIARTRVASPGNPPIAFTIAYDPARIIPNHRYVVRARVLLDEKLLFTTDTATSVITGGSPTNVKLLMRRVGGGQTPPRNPAGTRPLEGTYWKAIELAEKPTPTQDANREAHLLFQTGGRLSGSDGYNRLTGGYTARIDCNRGRGTWKSSGANQLQFGPLALTRAKCPAGSLHDQIVKQWSSIRSYVIKDDHLSLSLMADGGIYEFEPLRKRTVH